MITPSVAQSTDAVALHYDSLDSIYRNLWGDHVHHGFWNEGHESSQEAVENLVRLVSQIAGIKHGTKICDIGCGYGASSRLLAEEFAADVTSFTVSKKQYDYACAQSKNNDRPPQYKLCDWNRNQEGDDTFHTAISIESSEHFEDKRRMFSEAFRVLKPGGRFVVCSWIARENAKSLEVRYLLEPICREGRLPGMGTAAEYKNLLVEAGFCHVEGTDISDKVKRTWWLCVTRFIKAVLFNKEIRGLLLRKSFTDREFAKTIFRILVAYETRSMQYWIFSGTK